MGRHTSTMLKFIFYKYRFGRRTKKKKPQQISKTFYFLIWTFPVNLRGPAHWVKCCEMCCEIILKFSRKDLHRNNIEIHDIQLYKGFWDSFQRWCLTTSHYCVNYIVTFINNCQYIGLLYQIIRKFIDRVRVRVSIIIPLLKKTMLKSNLNLCSKRNKNHN